MRTYQPVPSSPGKDVQGALVVEGDNPQDVSAQLEHIQEVDTEPLEDSSGSHDSDGHFRGCSTRAAAFSVGKRVIYFSQSTCTWCHGEIEAVNDDGTYDVNFKPNGGKKRAKECRLWPEDDLDDESRPPPVSHRQAEHARHEAGTKGGEDSFPPRGEARQGFPELQAGDPQNTPACAYPAT